MKNFIHKLASTSVLTGLFSLFSWVPFYGYATSIHPAKSTESFNSAAGRLRADDGSVTVQGELKKWHKITLLIEGPSTSETNGSNPFLNYRLNVTFTNGSKKYVVPGYFAADGNAGNTGAASGNIWKVHFAPDQTGTWTYAISMRSGDNIAVSTDAGTAVEPLDGQSGQFTVSASDKTGSDLRAKGRLDYVGAHYLQFAETGEYFVKGGVDSPENLLAYDDFDNTPNFAGRRKSWSPHVQDWRSGDPTWKDGKGKGIIGAINYLASEGLNAFSFLTMNIIGDDRNVFPYVSSSDYTRFDCSKLDQWEVVFNHADKLGLYLHFKLQERENCNLLDGGNLGVQRKVYFRELIARFGHHLALNWNLGEENIQTDQQRKDMAAYLNATDPYNHHIVLHTNVKEQTAVYTPLLGSSSDLTGVSIQTDWNNVYKETREWVEKSANAGKKWVVANDEQNSVGVSTDASYAGKRGNVADNQDDMRKEALWGNLMGGGTGVEYYFGGNTGETDLAAEDFRSRAKMYRFTRYALDFFRTYVPLADSKPLNNVNTGWVIGQEGKVYIIYLKKGGTSQINTEGGRYTVQWYDPRNGGDLQSGTVRTISGSGSKSIGNPPNSADQDWVVLLRASQLTQPDPVPQTLYRVNAGGSSFTTSEGTVFSADNYASGGSLYSRSGDITNSAQDTLYLSERYGNFSYNFPVTNGSYTVILHFAEIYASDSNQRTFHVNLEGKRMLTGYDIFARAGGAWKAVQERFTVAVTDGRLTIDFESVVNNAKVSAIEVMAAATNAPPVLSPIGEQTVQAGSSLTVPLSASDTDGDAVTITALNLPEFAQLNNNVLTFAPGSGDVGRYPITVRATDSQQATDEETFTLVVTQAETAALSVTSFTLMNADTDGEIQELTDGAQLNLATLPTRNLNIRANTGAGPVGSVKLVLSGKQNRTQNEVGAPYALFADSDGDYRSWTPTVGSYSLTATPFPDAKGSGTAGRALTVSFSVISQAPAGRTGLEAQAESAGLTVQYYPNPFSESFTLQLRESSAGKRPVFIYDHTGRKIWERDDLPTGKHLIQPGQHLAPGLYILQIGQGPGAQRLKLIKTP